MEAGIINEDTCLRITFLEPVLSKEFTSSLLSLELTKERYAQGVVSKSPTPGALGEE